MLYGLFTTFGLEDFKKLLAEEKYDNLIYNCYYCYNQEEILGFLEKHLSMNNFILNYIYIRNSHKMGLFRDKDIVRKCLTLAFRTIYIIISQINLCLEINRKFEVLEIIMRKFTEKFTGYIDEELLEFAMNQSKKEILNFIDAMSANIGIDGGAMNKKYLDFPEPYIIVKISAGPWRYPALKYNENEDEKLKEKFVRNYSARCQRYYDAYQYTNEKLKEVFNDFKETGKFNLS